VGLSCRDLFGELLLGRCHDGLALPLGDAFGHEHRFQCGEDGLAAAAARGLLGLAGPVFSAS
jgi:hypothetical protein